MIIICSMTLTKIFKGVGLLLLAPRQRLGCKGSAHRLSGSCYFRRTPYTFSQSLGDKPLQTKHWFVMNVGLFRDFSTYETPCGYTQRMVTREKKYMDAKLRNTM